MYLFALFYFPGSGWNPLWEIVGVDWDVSWRSS